MIDVAPGTIVVFADIACPWSHVALHRLHETRAGMGLTRRVSFETRAFPLEIINSRPTPKRILDVEIPVAASLEPGAGWKMWDRPDYQYPVTSLPALEAVAAARAQGAVAAEGLDRALRIGLFAQSRCISLHHEILEVAETVDEVDVAELAEALQDGRARSSIFADLEDVRTSGVEGSPHVFLPDGTSVHNPGIDLRWSGRPGMRFPVVDADDPSVYEGILEVAAGRR